MATTREVLCLGLSVHKIDHKICSASFSGGFAIARMQLTASSEWHHYFLREKPCNEGIQ